MRAAHVLLVILAKAVSAGGSDVAPVRNVCVGHMSSTDVNLYWDWSEGSERPPQFAVSYEQIDMVTPKRFAPLKVRAAGEYRIQIVTLVLDAGRWLQSDPTFVNVTALAEDWPSPKNVSVTVIQKNDDNVLASISWDQKFSKNFTFSTVWIEEGYTTAKVRTQNNFLNYSFEYDTYANIRVFSEYNIDLGNGTTIVTMRKSPSIVFHLGPRSAVVPSKELLWTIILLSVLLAVLSLIILREVYARRSQQPLKFQPLLKPELECGGTPKEAHSAP